MRALSNIFCAASIILLVGCSSNEEANSNAETLSVNSSEETSDENLTSSTEKISEKDLEKSFLDYLGKDELEKWRERYSVSDSKEGDLKKGKILEAEELANRWAEIPYEDILQSIELYLKQEGFETVSPQLVAEYVDDQYRIEGLDNDIYETISYIATRLEESNSQGTQTVSNEQWEMLNPTQKNVLATNILNQSTVYQDFLPTYDMTDIPPGILVELVDDYVQVYSGSHVPDVLHYMNKALEEMLLADNHMRVILEHLSNGFNNNDLYILDSIYSRVSTYSNGFNEEFLQYQSLEMDFEFVEIIRMDPFVETYYGVADMTYSYKVNEENLKAYEEANNAAYPEELLFNGGKEFNNKKVRTLVVMKENEDTEFGYDIRSLYEIDKVSNYAKEFIKN